MCPDECQKRFFAAFPGAVGHKHFYGIHMAVGAAFSLHDILIPFILIPFILIPFRPRLARDQLGHAARRIAIGLAFAAV